MSRQLPILALPGDWKELGFRLAADKAAVFLEQDKTNGLRPKEHANIAPDFSREPVATSSPIPSGWGQNPAEPK